MTDKFDISEILDTCGTRCPIPLLRAKQALKNMQPGELLEVWATDPSAKPDFEAMLQHLSHELVHHSSSDDGCNVDTFIIRKG